MTQCPECGGLLVWGGMGWVPHSQGYHQRARKRLLRAAHRLLNREAQLKAWGAENAAQELVGVRWRNGVHTGWAFEDRWTIPQEYWDELTAEQAHDTLKAMRAYLTDQLREQHGLHVNPATWYHKIYDPRQET